MEWILIIWMLHAGNYNYNPTYIPGFSSQKECVMAGNEAVRDISRSAKYRCVSRTKN